MPILLDTTKKKTPGTFSLLLFTSDGEKPTDKGVMIYFNANGRLDDALAGVAINGGKVIQPKHAIGPFGFRAIIIDSEGNRVALHSD